MRRFGGLLLAMMVLALPGCDREEIDPALFPIIPFPQ